MSRGGDDDLTSLDAELDVLTEARLFDQQLGEANSLRITDTDDL